MRLFLFNPNEVYDIDMLSKKTSVARNIVRKEVSNLEKAGLVKKRSFLKAPAWANGKRKTAEKKRTSGYNLDKDFHYLSALQNLLIKIPPYTSRELEKRFKNCGSVKLLLISGVFLQEWDSVADILIVGDKLKNASLEAIIRKLESEIGRELSYAAFDTTEFEYRINVYDKLVRDILDFPHQKIVNKLDI